MSVNMKRNMNAPLTFFDLDSLVLQQFPKLLDFFLQFANQFSIRIFINNSFANNLFGSVGISVIEMLVIRSPL